MKTHLEHLTDVIDGVSDAHLGPHGASMTSVVSDTECRLTVVKGDWSVTETISLRGMPLSLQEEYVHCCVHTLASILLDHLYPDGRRG